MGRLLGSERQIATPSLVGSDDRTGTLEFARIDSGRALRPDDDVTWFQLAGRALALVHERLRLPPELAIVRQIDKNRPGNVCVHGDYMPNNLSVSGEKLVVFDWGFRPWTTERYTIASPAVDLAAFLTPWLVPKWWQWKFPAEKLRGMIRTYRQCIGPTSATYSAAMSTLHAELSEQYSYLRDLLPSRTGIRRPLAVFQCALNRRRLEKGVLRRLNPVTDTLKIKQSDTAC